MAVKNSEIENQHHENNGTEDDPQHRNLGSYSAASTAVSSDAALLKLGNELHGPEDWMRINQDHVLFIEKLKQDSKVSQAIRDYEEKN